MKVISTSNAPAAIGPYSQGFVVGNLVISSGQIPVNPENGEILMLYMRSILPLNRLVPA